MRREQQFPKMINEMNIKIGVEVGVASGHHSANILEKSNIEKLYCIDPYPNNLYWAKEKDGDKRYAEAQEVLKKWIGDGRAILLRKNSLDVVDTFEDNSVGFVYLDGDRTPEVFLQDVPRWLNKIKMGHILAGHDYKNKRGFKVKSMIDNFCEQNNYKLQATTEKCASWWFIKSH